MEHTKKHMGLSRLTSLLLVLAMLITMFPGVTHAHAAEAPSLVITNAEGEEADTFVVGEPIMVTASSNVAGDWVGFYDMKYPDTSAFWYYTSDANHENGGTYNAYDGEPNSGWAGWMMEPNETDGEGGYVHRYEIRLVEAGLKKAITIVAPEDAAYSSLEVEKNTVTAGENIRVKATSYKQSSWVALYSGSKSASDSFGGDYSAYKYVTGHNGIYMDFPVYAAGDYTMVLFADGGYTVDKVVNVTVEEPQEELPSILTTDKEVYAYGEAINVTVNASAYGSTAKDWVGIFNKGAVPSGSVNSYFWYYPSERGATYNVLNGTTNSLGNCVAGEYSIILLANDGYSVITSVDITITKEEVSRVVTDPTCTEAGTITITYSDGTTETIPGEKATGHAYGGWTSNNDDKSHSKVCGNDATHVITEDCTWDEGTVTKEPTTEEAGVKTYTCSVCEGTKEETIPALVVEEVGREVVAPTCTEEGYTLVTYSDGTTQKIDIVSALGHDTEGVAWTGIDVGTHGKLCSRCKEVAETENHSMTGRIENGITYHTCTVCGYVHEEVMLATDKKEYTFGEPIIVTVNGETYAASGNDWVGLYKKGEKFNPDMGGVKSIYWYYISELGATVDINWRTNPAVRNENGRDGEFVGGEYTVALLTENGGNWYYEITTVDIVITAVVTKTEVVEPTCEEDGYTYIEYNDGTTETIPGEKATGHAYGDWTSNNDDKSHSKVCGNDATHVITEDCTWDEGTVTKEPTTEEAGVKTYTCSVCEGTKEETIPALAVEEVDREVVAPTCTEEGYTLVTYSDGTTQKINIVSALGHDWGHWTHVERTRTHTHVCQREGCGATETEDCVLEYEGVRGDQLECNCRTCGDYFEDLLWTDKAVYASGEDIIVTVNPNYEFGAKDWIGLYKAGEAPVYGGLTSIRWDYVSVFEEGMSIFQTNWHDRPAEDVDNLLAAGEYWLYLCKNDGYEVVTHISFNVTAEELSRETVAPTCEEDGYVLAHYSDGTSKIVVTAEEDPSLKAIGHAYGDWVYNKETKQHTKTCANDAAHVITESCSFDEGVVTKEPTATEKGEKTFTCSVCHGTYTQELAATGVELVETKTTKEPTCTEPGVETAYYSDGSTIETPIPALGHSFEGAQWTYNSEDKTHSRGCVRNCGHTETEACDMVLDEEKGVFECGTCGGSYIAFIINTDKTEYKFGEPIYVTVNPNAYTASGNDWVGLYRKGEKVDPDNGGAFSIYWYYISELGNVVDINWRTNPAVRNENGRDGDFKPGEYSVVLLTEKDGNWYYQIAAQDITIIEEEIDLEGNTYGLEINGEAAADGAKLTFQQGDEIKLKPMVEGLAGSGWMGVYIASYDYGHDFSTTPSDWWDYFYNINGKEINLADKIGLEAGHYTVAFFADGGYDKVQMILHFEIVRTYVDYQVIKEATCLLPGQAKVLYEGETEYVTEPIPALGHDWSYSEETHTHTCQREACGVTEGCEYVSVTDENGNVTHTCKECRGSYTEPANPGDEEMPTELLRMAGENRIATSLLTAAKMKELMGVEKFDAVVVASGLNFPDALSGSYLAAVKKAPILLTAPGFEKDVNAFIQENLAEGGTVYVLGGEAAVPNALLEGLEGVKRVAGENRLGTNLEILKEAGVTGNDLLICTAMNFPDSLSAAAAGKPILLVSGKLTAEQEAFLQLLGEKNYYIIGGTSAVSKDVEFALQSYGGTVRLAGSGRYDTSVKIAETFFADPDAVILAYGRNYPDGLCGGAMAAALGAPVILVEDAFIDQAAEYVQSKGIAGGYILGGTGLLSDASVRTIWALAEDAEIGAIK